MERADLDRWKPREVARLLALVETERRYYQEIVAHLPVGLAVVTSDFWIVSANRSFRQFFAIKTEDIGRLRLPEVVRVDDFNERILDAITSGTPQHNILYSPPGEKEPRFFRVSVLPLRNWEDEMEMEALLVFEDLTGVEGAAERPAEPAKPVLMPAPAPPPSAARLLENLDAVVWEADADGRLLSLSPYAETMLGYPVSHWLEEGAPWEERVHPDDREFVTALLRDAVAQRTRLHLEYRARTAAGRTLWARESIRVQRDPAGQPVRLWGVIVDVTENRRLAERMLLAHKMEALSRLSSRTAHQFNNFLMVVSSYGQDLMDLLPADSPLRADVEQILNAAEKVSALTGKLLNFSRRPVSRPTIVEFADLVSTALQPVLAGAPAEVELVRKLAPVVGSVEVDPAQVPKALSDLMIAALRASRTGRVVVETSRMEDETPTAGSPGCACLSIQAPSWEMDAEARRRLFEPEIMAGEGSPALSEAYWLIRQNHGEVLVTGESGGGATITVWFPLVGVKVRSTPPVGAVSASKVVPLPVAEPEQAAPPAAGVRTALVAEDEEGIRALLRKILVQNGFQVLEASSVGQALETVHAHSGQITLLVTDMVMEDGSGRELAERLRASIPSLKVVFVSGYTEDAAIHAGELPEGTAFLQKPFTVSSFLEKIREVLH